MNKTMSIIAILAAAVLMSSGLVVVLQEADASSSETSFTIKQKQRLSVSGVGNSASASQNACNIC